MEENIAKPSVNINKDAKCIQFVYLSVFFSKIAWNVSILP